MTSIFNYSTINVDLIKKTRTLQVTLKDFNTINLELLFELESVLAWSTNKIEIHSILIKSNQGLFSIGLDTQNLKNYDENKLLKISQKLQKLTHAMFHLPQTIILDLGMGAMNLGLELAVGADIRIAHNEVDLSFNHTELGLVPCSGGMGILSNIIGHTYAKNWILMGKKISKSQLQNSGFIYESYGSNRESLTQEILTTIHKQSPIQRVQAKLGVFEPIRESIEKAATFEQQVGRAARISQDWKNSPMPAKHMSNAVKLSIVKKDESPIN